MQLAIVGIILLGLAYLAFRLGTTLLNAMTGNQIEDEQARRPGVNSVWGAFENAASAERAADALVAAGFPRERVHFIVSTDWGGAGRSWGIGVGYVRARRRRYQDLQAAGYALVCLAPEWDSTRGAEAKAILDAHGAELSDYFAPIEAPFF